MRYMLNFVLNLKMKLLKPPIGRWLASRRRLHHGVERPKIAVAMSGGIDSAVSAMLLKESGYDCVGVFMRNWDGTDELGRSPDCPIDRDLRDMQEVCKALDIKTVEVEFIKEYWNNVFEPFLETYKTGYMTPNPDVMCNKYIKFHYFKKYVLEKLGLERMATGHYANVTHYKYRGSIIPQLTCPKDNFKDQTYFLSLTEACAFQDVVFPLGSLLKSQVKDIARIHPKLSQCTAILEKKESMGLCFVGPRSGGGAKFGDFLGQYLAFTPGRFIDASSGAVVGKHSGIESLTLGQKANIGGCSRKYFVVSKVYDEVAPYLPLDIDQQAGDVYVGNSDHPALFKSHIITNEFAFNWLTCGVSAKLKVENFTHSSVDLIKNSNIDSGGSDALNTNVSPFLEAQRLMLLHLFQEIKQMGLQLCGLEVARMQSIVNNCFVNYQRIPLIMPYELQSGIVDVHGLHKIQQVVEKYLDPITHDAPIDSVKGTGGIGMRVLSISITGMELCNADENSTFAHVDFQIHGLTCMHRYRQGRIPCSVRIRHVVDLSDEKLYRFALGRDDAAASQPMEVWFENENGDAIKERAPTPGQTLVLYHNNYCLGGGEIK